jgi:hypothetical protein
LSAWQYPLKIKNLPHDEDESYPVEDVPFTEEELQLARKF